MTHIANYYYVYLNLDKTIENWNFQKSNNLNIQSKSNSIISFSKFKIFYSRRRPKIKKPIIDFSAVSLNSPNNNKTFFFRKKQFEIR